MRKIRALLGAVMVCGACGGSSLEPQFQILDPGTGAPNVLPLLPLSIGYRGSRFVDGTRDSAAGPLYRMSNFDSLEAFWYRREERGIFYAGGTDDGLRQAPALLVPATVRDGMRWNFSTDGVVDVEYTVLPHGTNDAGETTWTIRAHDPQDTVVDYSTTYIEGLGESAQAAFLDAHARFVAPKRLPLTLEPIAASTNDDWALSPGMVRIGDGPAMLVGSDSGYDETSYCQLFDGVKLLNDLVPTGTGGFIKSTTYSCPQRTACAYNEDRVPICTRRASGDANGAYVSPDGTLYWLPREDGKPIRVAIGATTSDDTTDGPFFFPLAIVPGGKNGEPRVVGYNNGYGGNEVALRFDTTFFAGYYDPDATYVRSTWRTLPNFERVIAMPQANGATGFLLVTGSGLVFTSLLPPTGSPTPPVLALRTTGKISVLVTDKGTEASA